MKLFPSVLATCAILTLLQITETKSIVKDKHDVMKDDHNLASTKVFQNKLNCQVHSTYSQENWLGKPLHFLAFIEHGERFSALIGFQDQHMASSYDQILISQEEIELAKIRKGNVHKTTFNQYLDTAGWTRIEISVNNHQFILKYENNTALNYTVDQPVHELTIHGSNITICKDGSPTWILEQGQSAEIPLEPSRQAVNQIRSRTYVIKLQSDHDFTPCIRFDGEESCLGLKNHMLTFANSSKLLPLTAGIWDMNLEIITGFINIYQKIGGEQKNVISYSKQGMKFIEVTSNYSHFSVSLDPFAQPNPSSRVDVTAHQTVTIMSYDDTQPNNGIKPEIYMVIGIIIGIALGGLMMWAVFVILRKKESTTNVQDQNEDHITTKSTNLDSNNSDNHCLYESRQSLLDMEKNLKNNMYPSVKNL